MKKQLVITLAISTLWLSACQKPSETHLTVTAEQKANPIPLIQAKTQLLNLAHDEVCHVESAEESANCTKYHLQSISSNVAWLDDYFNTRIKSEHTEAFANTPKVKVNLDPDLPSTNYSTASVRYIGQHYNIATFEYFVDYLPAGAAHGMHHSEYMVFDLATQQQLTLNDILQPVSKEQLKTELYSFNSEWLEQHHITAAEFQLSDNFYLSATGIVFVYPLYELASYAEGLTELTLPYWSAKDFIQEKYLPQLPVQAEIYQ